MSTIAVRTDTTTDLATESTYPALIYVFRKSSRPWWSWANGEKIPGVYEACFHSDHYTQEEMISLCCDAITLTVLGDQANQFYLQIITADGALHTMVQQVGCADDDHPLPAIRKLR
jgi:hypothetical protein